VGKFIALILIILGSILATLGIDIKSMLSM
jgi:hypothetical protein